MEVTREAEGGDAAVGRARPDAAQLAEVEQRHDKQRDEEGVVAESAMIELIQEAVMLPGEVRVHGAQADGAGGETEG
ncbi:hypothetical protein [Paraburkholderia kururiensis]|jgi:hypothetical protein|uniref:hypothetical protein n=1 Tax=Paraburkholderia kururiensis TaxID=984307 RepID=UPI0018F3C513|nr:hypothetical protein [Paraburkholderia kururiensis]